MENAVLPKKISFCEQYYGINKVEDLMDLIPNTYSKKSFKSTNFAEEWFMYGLKKEYQLFNVPEIDKEMAIKHIDCIFSTWFLTRDEKIKSAACLIDDWFERIVL